MLKVQKAMSCIVFCLSLICVWSVYGNNASEYNLLYRLDIIHYNDFHARFEENTSTMMCHYNHESCMGGFPRLYHEINVILKEKPDAVLLNAGDSFQGTYWYTLLKWNITQQFMSLLSQDAHVIYNDEYEDGSEGLVPYLKALKSYIGSSVDDTSESSFKGTYKPSIIIKRKGKKIGIIGLLTTDKKLLSDPGNVKFTDPGDATHQEVMELVKQGVNIIILLSHCGLDIDKKLARKYGNYVDIIIGGRTHSLLQNVTKEGSVNQSYPVIIEAAPKKNKKVLLVQASTFTKFLGNLSVYFNELGELKKWEGNVIYLDKSVEEDGEIKDKFIPYSLVISHRTVPVAVSYVQLDSEDCGSGECGLGDILADAMTDYARKIMKPDRNYISFIQRGIIRSKIDIGEITQSKLQELYPMRDRVEYFKMKGLTIRQILERSVSNATSYYDPFDGPWLLQVSGLQVVYNISLPEGSRVVSMTTNVDGFKTPMQATYVYDVIAPSLWSSSHEYSNFKRFKTDTVAISRDANILKIYLAKISPVNITTDGRIQIYK